MKRLFHTTIALAIITGMLLPSLVLAADVRQEAVQDYNKISSQVTRFTGVTVSDILETSGLKNADAKICVAKNILGQIGDIIKNFNDVLISELGNAMSTAFSIIKKQIIMCALGGALNKILFGVFPQCTIAVTSDTAQSYLKQREQAWKQNFIGRCVAMVGLQNISDRVVAMINEGGPDGGSTYAVPLNQSLFVRPDQEAEKTWWAILVHTDICPYFRESALNLLRVPQSYRTDPPNIDMLATRVDGRDPFSVRAACTLPEDYNPLTRNLTSFSYLSLLGEPQNRLGGFIMLANEERSAQQQAANIIAQAEYNAGGGFTSVYGKCIKDSDGNCVSRGPILQPAGATRDWNYAYNIFLPGELLANTDGTDHKQIQDLAAQIANHMLNIANRPLPFKIEFGFEDDPEYFTPVPTPSVLPDDVNCVGGEIRCSCIKNNSFYDSYGQNLIGPAMEDAKANHPELFDPAGSNHVAGDLRAVLGAICDSINAKAGGEMCIPHPRQDDEVVIIGTGMTYSFDVISGAGDMHIGGGFPIAACEPGVQN